MLGDTGQVVWVTDAAGDDALEIDSVIDEPETETVRLAEGLLGNVLSLAASPDGATVAAAAHDGRLLAVDVTSGQVTELAASDDGAVDGLAWSPDSAWLAWSQPGTQPLRRIRMARIARPAGGSGGVVPPGQHREVINVTDGRFTDTDPVFSLDGLYLAFISRRSFDPVYDAQTFDLSFPFGSRPYLVPLAAQTPSPFGPLPGGRPVGQDPPEPDKDTSDSPERTEVSVDAEGLPGRVVGVPVIEARYSGLRATKGGLAWLREPVSGVLGEGSASAEDDAPRPVLERFDLRKREVTELAGELDWFDVSGDGTRLVVRDRDDLRVLPAEHIQDRGSGEVGHRRPVPGQVHRRSGRAVAARLRRGPADAPRLLDPGHVRGGLGRGARHLPSAARPGPQRGRFRRPDVGGGGRTRHVARLHHRGRRGRPRVLGSGPPRPSACSARTCPATSPAAGWWTGCCRASRPTRGRARRWRRPA